MKAILVDDERLALKKMEKLLQEQAGAGINLELIGAFQDPYSAIEAAEREMPHLAFLDIEMPEINGFELAERLLQVHPHLQIIFVTAYQEYAVKAFEVNAIDYLLKPVHHGRLAMTLKRVIESSSKTVVNNSEASQKSQSKLCCLQSLHYYDQSGVQQYFPWKTLKAPELFAYLVHYRDKTVSKQLLIDLLWPEYDTERATTQLHTAIYQIRKIIKTAGLDLEIKYKDEGYRLIWGELKLDVEEWETCVRQAQAVSPETLDEHRAILALYTGDFLEEHRYFWAENEQERLGLIWLTHVKQIAEYYTSHGEYTEALLLYQQIRERSPYVEDGYFGLMQVYDKLNHQGEVRKQYQLISSLLKEEFDAMPSKEISDWYGEWNGRV
jgi:two-component system, LytTR family, response regulator